MRLLSYLLLVLRRHLLFSRKEHYGLGVLFFLIGISLLIPLVVSYLQYSQLSHLSPLEAARLTALLKKAGVAENRTLSQQKGKASKFLDINLATAADLQSLQGIGPVRAKRILAYRDQLGGFISTDQYAEVSGLPTAVIEQLKQRTSVAVDFVPYKMPLNTVTVAQLAQHPYLTYNQAHAIVAYRKQHGVFKDIKGLDKVAILTTATKSKLNPYLTL